MRQLWNLYGSNKTKILGIENSKIEYDGKEYLTKNETTNTNVDFSNRNTEYDNDIWVLYNNIK